MGWWRDIWVQRAETWTFASLSPEQTPGARPVAEVAPDTRYVQIRLKSMHVVDVRRGLSRFYGTVHSFASVPHRGGDDAEFNTLTTPASLKDIDAARLDRVIPIDQPLLGPVPFRGGELSIQVGLFSIKSQDLVGPYLDLLGDLSRLSGVSFISAAKPFAEPLVRGINLLTGGADATVLEVGLSMKTRVPRTGYYVVVRAPRGSLDPSNLQVSDDDFVLTNRGHSIGEFPYMVLEITADEQRADWFSIPELQKPYTELTRAIREGQIPAVEQALITFERTAVTCDDLLFADALRLKDLVRSQVQLLFPSGRTSRSITGSNKTGGTDSLPPLGAIPLYG